MTANPSYTVYLGFDRNENTAIGSSLYDFLPAFGERGGNVNIVKPEQLFEMTIPTTLVIFYVDLTAGAQYASDQASAAQASFLVRATNNLASLYYNADGTLNSNCTAATCLDLSWSQNPYSINEDGSTISVQAFESTTQRTSFPSYYSGQVDIGLNTQGANAGSNFSMKFTMNIPIQGGSTKTFYLVKPLDLTYSSS